MKRITIKDVAEHAGVSIKTVSRVLNNEPHVRPDVREKVLAAVRASDYKPNLLARDFAAKTTRVVAFFFLRAERMFSKEYYFTEIFDAAQKELSRRGYATIFFAPEGMEAAAMGEHIADIAQSRKLSGVMLADLIGLDYRRLREAQVPAVVLSRRVTGPRIASIVPTNAEGMSEVVRYVCGLGHRRVGFFGKVAAKPSFLERLEGYRRTLDEFGIRPDPAWVYECEGTDEAWAVERVGDVLSRPPDRRPTALCCSSDLLAIAALKEMQSRGVALPEEMSITGFDDNDMCEVIQPPLTTVAIPRGEMGRLASEKLIALARNEAEGDITEVRTRLVVRESCCPPAARVPAQAAGGA